MKISPAAEQEAKKGIRSSPFRRKLSLKIFLSTALPEPKNASDHCLPSFLKPRKTFLDYAFMTEEIMREEKMEQLLFSF